LKLDDTRGGKNMKEMKTLEWKNDKLVLLDQTKLPNDVIYEEFDKVEDVWDAIRIMKVRGAPVIGVTAAYGVYIGIRNACEESFESFYKELKKVTEYLATSRPTAVNLFWALERMEQKAQELKDLSVPEIKSKLLEEAILIHKEDEEINKAIGENLLSLLKDGMGVLTHCNAGALATTKYGTATSPM
jgi:methylthioribose-1-phosphate isomerase